jgi:hypothetical protein
MDKAVAADDIQAGRTWTLMAVNGAMVLALAALTLGPQILFWAALIAVPANLLAIIAATRG